jgi:hypothetical protein
MIAVVYTRESALPAGVVPRGIANGGNFAREVRHAGTPTAASAVSHPVLIP